MIELKYHFTGIQINWSRGFARIGRDSTFEIYVRKCVEKYETKFSPAIYNFSLVVKADSELIVTQEFFKDEDAAMAFCKKLQEQFEQNPHST